MYEAEVELPPNFRNYNAAPTPAQIRQNLRSRGLVPRFSTNTPYNTVNGRPVFKGPFGLFTLSNVGSKSPVYRVGNKFTTNKPVGIFARHTGEKSKNNNRNVYRGPLGRYYTVNRTGGRQIVRRNRNNKFTRKATYQNLLNKAIKAQKRAVLVHRNLGPLGIRAFGTVTKANQNAANAAWQNLKKAYPNTNINNLKSKIY